MRSVQTLRRLYRRVRCLVCDTVFTTKGNQNVCGECALKELMGK